MLSAYFVGIDIGSSYTKSALINENKELLAEFVLKTGINFEQTSIDAFQKVLKIANLKKEDILRVVSTGVGRNNCSFSNFKKPEINCISKGAFNFYPQPITVVDIGGQDNKIIKIGKNGEQLSFKMNRKCASGTGSFLEEISNKLDLSSQQMNQMAEEADETVSIGSFCTVFAGTEIIHHIRDGKNINGIIKGVYDSIVKRILEMDFLESKVLVTGGVVAKSPILKKIFSEKLNFEVEVPRSPQMVGAVGASLFGFENYMNKKV